MMAPNTRNTGLPPSQTAHDGDSGKTPSNPIEKITNNPAKNMELSQVFPPSQTAHDGDSVHAGDPGKSPSNPVEKTPEIPSKNIHVPQEKNRNHNTVIPTIPVQNRFQLLTNNDYDNNDQQVDNIEKNAKVPPIFLDKEINALQT